LLFNGNLFRRDTAAKTKKVLDSLSADEQAKVAIFEQDLRSSGALALSTADGMLGAELLSKLRAAAVFDVNIVSNEAGDHALITLPGAFHKFTSPLIDDAFDHAKALVAALKYGMSQSSSTRGRIWGILDLLRKHFPEIDTLASYRQFGETLADDIYRHAVLNEDWDNSYILERVGFLTCSQARLFQFLEDVSHPVRRDQNDQDRLVARLNPILRRDGYAFVASGKISGYPVYKVQQTVVTGVQPADALISEALISFDESGVHAGWQKALDRRVSDADGAITAAKALLETVCKHIIEEAGGHYGDNDDLPRLYSVAAERTRCRVCCSTTARSMARLRGAALSPIRRALRSFSRRTRSDRLQSRGTRAANRRRCGPAAKFNRAGDMSCHRPKRRSAHRHAGCPDRSQDRIPLRLCNSRSGPSRRREKYSGAAKWSQGRRATG